MGAASLLSLLGVVLLLMVYFTSSLAYLCWVTWNGQRKQVLWLNSSRPAMAVGLMAVLGLATFADGASRFWDKPFDIQHWVILVLICASAWAALFCHLIGSNGAGAGINQKIVAWTVSLSIVCGIFIQWRANGRLPEYSLRRNVTEHTRDPQAWLDLAGHYKDQGDALAIASDDEDRAPDPTPYYQEALDCTNRAIQVGATGFDFYLIGAQLADSVGQSKAALSFAQEAHRFSTGSTPDAQDEIKWLREVVARNTDAPASLTEEERQRRVRAVRRERLPAVVRWIFH
jgi:hypothetical protein